MSSSTQRKKANTVGSAGDNSSFARYVNSLQAGKPDFGRSVKGGAILKVNRRGPRNKVLIKIFDKLKPINEVTLFTRELKKITLRDNLRYSQDSLNFFYDRLTNASATQAQLAASTTIKHRSRVRKKSSIQMLAIAIKSLYQTLEITTDPGQRSLLIDSIDKFETRKEEIEMSQDSARWEALQETAQHFAEKAQNSFSPELMPDSQ